MSWRKRLRKIWKWRNWGRCFELLYMALIGFEVGFVLDMIHQLW